MWLVIFNFFNLGTAENGRFRDNRVLKTTPRKVTSPIVDTNLAYLAIISNENFVDGAIVLGASLRNHSQLLAAGTAHLVVIITEGRVGPVSQARLQRDGTYDAVIEVPSLAKRAPGAFLKDTFDKVYMFNMTKYHRIVFMDADMLCLRSPDKLFKMPKISPDSLGAIGFKGDSPYFQTGMLVIEPNREMFKKIMEEFASGVPPKGHKYNHGMHGRDGVLLRAVFRSNFRMIDNKYSRNLNPRLRIPDNVVSLHFRGSHKPWYNRSKPLLDPELGKKEFGFGYAAWWRAYEAVHASSDEYKKALGGEVDLTYGGSAAGPGISPITHVWMMRYTKDEYVQLREEVSTAVRNTTLPNLRHVVGKVNESCKSACSKLGLNCAVEQFQSSFTESCGLLTQLLGCSKGCEMGVYWRQHPGNDYPSMDVKKMLCTYNYLRDERSLPTCEGFHEDSKRLCPCI